MTTGLLKHLGFAALCLLPEASRAQSSLQVRVAKGPSGYSTVDLVKNLHRTQENIRDLLVFLEKRPPPVGSDAAYVQKDLMTESAACAALIAEADAALKGGIARVELPKWGARSKAEAVHRDGSLVGRRREVAAQRALLAGQLAALIEEKASGRELPALEVQLKSSRADLETVESQLTLLQNKKASEDAQLAGRKALQAAPRRP